MGGAGNMGGGDACRPYFEDVAVGDRGPQRRHALSRTDFVQYAGASGDLNPLHHDELKAQAAGMPSVFGHGMLSAGFLAGAVTDFVGLGALTRFSVRFTKQAWPDTVIRTEVEVRDKHLHGGTGRVDLDCRLIDDKDNVIVLGEASAALPLRADHSGPGVQAGGPGDGLDAAVSARGDLTGTPLPPAVLVVERGPVQVFAGAVQDTRPAYSSPKAAAEAGLTGVPVPPTYLFSLAHWGAFPELQPPRPAGSMTLVELIAALRDGEQGVILHGGQEFEYHAPVCVGNVLRVDGTVEKVDRRPPTKGRPGMSVMVVRTDYRSENHELVARARATFLFRRSDR